MTSTAAARTSHDQQPETTGDASRYPAQVRSITWHLLADSYAVTWAPAPAGCSLTLVLLFGMLVSRITQLTKDNVVEDGQATCLAIDGHRLMLPPRLADLVRRLRDQDEPRWTLGRLGTSTPWLFPGQSPALPGCGYPVWCPAAPLRHRRSRRPQHRPPRRGCRTARLGAGRPDRHQHQHRRTLVPVGQARLGRPCRPACSRHRAAAPREPQSASAADSVSAT